MKSTHGTHSWSLGLVPRIILLSVFGVLLLGVTVTAVAWKVLADAATDAARERVETNIRVAWDTVKANGSAFSRADNKLTVGNRVLNDDFATVDKIKSLVGGTATIFMNDQRVATNVMKPDGTRAVGTRLAPGPAYTTVLENRQPFRGEVAILGEPYMTAYDPIVDAGGNVIGILYVGIKKADFEAAAYQTLWTIAAATLAVALLAVLASFAVVRGTIARPLRAAIATMQRLAAGDLATETPQPHRQDEIGEILKALAVFKEHGLEVERLRCEQEKAKARAEMERRTEMMRLATEFEGAVGEIVGTVSSSANELEASAGSLTGTATRSRQLAMAVSSAAEEASTNVQSVASATEEMASSVNEISRQVQESARIAQEAVEQAHLTNDRVADLSKAAARIGDVVELINTIAGQTNLLALNATI
ncbi:methyl-accepting chemotaxis protein, partial [Rhodopseudomonas palustris]